MNNVPGRHGGESWLLSRDLIRADVDDCNIISGTSLCVAPGASCEHTMCEGALFQSNICLVPEAGGVPFGRLSTKRHLIPMLDSGINFCRIAYPGTPRSQLAGVKFVDSNC